MRICFVADYRSPIARQWIDWVAGDGHDVHVIASRPLASTPLGMTSDVEPLGPVAAVRRMSALLPGRTQSPAGAGRSKVGGRTERLLRRAAPAELRLHASRLHHKIAAARPDVVHAMRLPYEAMAVAQRPPTAPWIASIWGNDLTLYAAGSRGLGRATRRTLSEVDALHTDCQRDQDLAVRWGFDQRKPRLVVPGSGGVDVQRFRPGPSDLRRTLGIPSEATVILNPRGVRAYVHLAQFLDAADEVLRAHSDVHVIALGIDESAAVERIGRMQARDRVHLLPSVGYDRMPDLYRAADITVSLTSHDGTPNSLLEALASGCFPVVGPVTSVLEWVTDGVNGMTADPRNAAGIAATLTRAVKAREFRSGSRAGNRQLIESRGDLETCMPKAIEFYSSLVATRS